MTKLRKPDGDAPAVRPITACDGSGRPYERPREVQHQIESTQTLDSDALLVAADDLRDETLVYLIRDRRRARDWAVAKQLMHVLVERCRGILVSTLRSLPQDVRDEAIRTVLEQLFTRICVLDERGDFYEVRFGLALKRLGTSAFRQCVLTIARHRVAEQQSAERDDSRNAPFDPYQWPEDAVDFQEALKGLEAIKDEQHRMAFVLHKVREMPIVSDDPEAATISQYFRVSPRTINNWLKQAEADLARWRKGLS